MWLTLTGHIAMWPTSKEFTSVIKLVHIIMWLRLNEFWGLIMFCLWEVLVKGLQHSDPYVLCKSLGYIVNVASTLHLKLFQMVAPLYVSGLLLRVIQIGVKACINVTLYVKLFITSIIEKHILIPLRIILTAIWWSTPWSPLYSLARHVARHTSGAVLRIAYCRAYV